MTLSRRYLIVPLLAVLILAACGGADSDRTSARRDLAKSTCEDAVSNQLASRATARFSSESDHVYYDSVGGAAVAGIVATATGQRNFACILKPATDSTWLLSEARLLN
ncbi:MAG: hypothetical protein ABI338_07655 [Gemmatimonadaceae bacterium]